MTVIIQKPGGPNQPHVVYGAPGSPSTGALNGAATYRSDWVDLGQYAGGISFDVGWTGGSGLTGGALAVEVSNAASPPDINTACATAPLSYTPVPPSGVSGKSAVDVPSTGFRFARLAATITAGSCTLTANGFVKVIGH